MSRYDTYIFDLDGTLLNTLGDLAASVNHALRSFGMEERGIDFIRMSVGNGVGNLIMRSVPGGTAAETADKVLAVFKEHYTAHGQELTAPYPGIVDMLRRLKASGARTAVVSNKFDAATKRLCAHYFGGMIDVAIGESEGIRRKPAPDTVEEAMRQLRASRENAVYVGDSDVDIATARNSRLPCISVLWGFRDRAFLSAHGASVLAESPADIL